MKLRYSEAFYSVQGEGKFVGVPSVFLRTFGCNFRCMNFGLGKDEPSRAEKLAGGQRYNQEQKSLQTCLSFIQDVIHMLASILNLKTLTNLQKLMK